MARHLLVLAPNWLGDAVMAVPSVEAIRRQYPSATLAVAARSHLAPLYEMVHGVDEVLHLEPPGRFGGWLAALGDARRLRAARFDVAILLPNSFRAAWLVRRAGIAERWGYASDGRALLLTRPVPTFDDVHFEDVHQVEYYRRLLEGLGISTSPESGVRSPESQDSASTSSPRPEPGEGRRDLPSVHLDVPADAGDWARRTLEAHARKAGEPLVGMAPGAAYGGAKQWPPERFAQVAIELAASGVRTVLVGSAGDRDACDRVARTAGKGVINLVGATNLRQLAAVMAACRSFVSNDSGAMHLAAAVGVPVVAIFGSTNEKETSPLPLRPGTGDARGTLSHAILTTDVSCRPCMLRECPIEGHPCMTGIDAARVVQEVVRRLK